MRLIFSSLFLLLLSSCGDAPVGISSNTIGEVRSFSGSGTVLGELDVERLTAICGALAQKEAILDSSVGTSHLFSISQTDCEGNTIASGNIEATIQKSGTSYFFRKTDGTDFLFPEIETRSSGIFSQICSGTIATLSNPIVSSNEVIFLATTAIPTTNCSPKAGEICLQIERGSREGELVTIHTKEWMRFRVNSTNGRVGFSTQKTKLSRSYCGQNEAIELRASLK